MKVPISETTSAINRLRKVDTRRGRHKLNELRTFRFFSTASVNRRCLLTAVLLTLARTACAPAVSECQQVYTEHLGSVPALSKLPYTGAKPPSTNISTLVLHRILRAQCIPAECMLR